MTAPHPSRVPVHVIVAGLAARIVELCELIFPAGTHDGAEYRVGSPRGEPGQSLAIHLRQDGRAGVRKDFTTQEKGDVLDLVRVTQFPASPNKTDAIKWAKTWLGYDGSAQALDVQRKAAEAAKKNREKAIADADRRRKSAKAMFLNATEIKGTPAETYLRGRAIDPARIGAWSGSLRYTPALEIWERRPGEKKSVCVGKAPAMLAAIIGPDGEMLAVHRTYLQCHADGRVTKAPIVDRHGKPAAKKSYGTYAGGCIRLFKPIVEGKRAPALAQAPAGSKVAISEGIEDGLSYAMLERDRYVLVAVSLGNLGCLWLPDTIDDVLILGQNDVEPDAIKSLDAAAQRFAGQGRVVRVSKPPADYKDLNDLVMGKKTISPKSADATADRAGAAACAGVHCLPVQLSPSDRPSADGDFSEGDNA